MCLLNFCGYSMEKNGYNINIQYCSVIRLRNLIRIEVFEIDRFWTNSIYYILLGIISAALLIWTIYKSKQRKRDLGFFFAIFGLTLFIETVIYIFLKAYEYYPLIIPHSPKNDGVVGNIFSQISISTAALFVCVYKVPIAGVVLAGAVFYLTEELFLALGIYQHNWYKSWITFVGVIILFQTIKKWYKLTASDDNHIIQYITIILGAIALYLPTTNWIGILSGFFDVKEDILIDPFISHAVVAIPKYLIQLNMIYFLIKRKSSWLWKIAFIIFIVTVDVILYYTKLIYVREGWLLIYSGISLFTAYLYIYIMNKLLYGNKAK